MPSASLSCNRTVYRKEMTRFWPLWGLYGIIWIFVIPLNLLLDSRYYESGEVLNHCREHILRMLPDFGVGMALVFGILAAMAVWSYLYNNRSVAMMHALPIRREGLFLSNWLAGMSFCILPHLVVALTTLGVGAICGVLLFKEVLLWFVVQSLLCLFFFSFATLCAFVTGNLLALPVLYGIFNGLVIGLIVTINWVLEILLYGYNGFTSAMDTLSIYGTPVVAFATRLRVDATYDTESGTQLIHGLYGVSTVAVYALIGVGMAVLAFLLYRRRSLELSGEVVSVSWLRPVFKYGVAFCGALSLGVLLFVMFSYNSGSVGLLLFFMLLGGTVCYYAAEMLLKKSFRVFRNNWKGCVAFLALLTVGSVAVNLDVMGYESWLPSESEVAKVRISDFYAVPSDSFGSLTDDGSLQQTPEEIAQTLALHQSILDNRDEEPQSLSADGREVGSLWIPDSTYQRVRLKYTLKDGKTVSRFYSILVSEETLKQEESPAARLDMMLNRTETLKKGLFPEVLQAENLVGGSVRLFTERGIDGEDTTEVSLQREDAQLLYAAILEDLEAGRFGKRWLLENEQYYNTVYENVIKLSFEGDFSSIYGSTDEAGQVYAESSHGRELYTQNGVVYADQREAPDFVNVYLQPQTDSSATLEVLKQLGMLEEDTAFRSSLQYQQQQNNRG